MLIPQLPPQRAVYFPDNLPSGATIGYHCVIVGLHESSLLRTPFQRDLWVYRVYVPHLNCHLDLPALNLFVTGDLDLSDLPPDYPTMPACKICFAGEVADDNVEIRGALRVLGRKWSRFTFRKCSPELADYQLRIDVAGERMGSIQFAYNVPNTERLDKRFVLRALAELIGTEEWREV